MWFYRILVNISAFLFNVLYMYSTNYMCLGSGSSGLAARVLHVLNAPSPAATSSMSIAEMVVERAVKQFKI